MRHRRIIPPASGNDEEEVPAIGLDLRRHVRLGLLLSNGRVDRSGGPHCVAWERIESCDFLFIRDSSKVAMFVVATPGNALQKD